MSAMFGFSKVSDPVIKTKAYKMNFLYFLDWFIIIYLYKKDNKKNIWFSNNLIDLVSISELSL